MKKNVIFLLLFSFFFASNLTAKELGETKQTEKKVIQKKDLKTLEKEIDLQKQKVGQLSSCIKKTEKKVKEATGEEKTELEQTLKNEQDELAKAKKQLDTLNSEYKELKVAESNRVYKLAVTTLDSASVDSLYYKVCVIDSSHYIGIVSNKLDSASVDSLYRSKCIGSRDNLYTEIEVIFAAMASFILGILSIILCFFILKRKKDFKKHTPKPKIKLERETVKKDSYLASLKIKGSK